MAQVKNVRPYAVDAGGRTLASGETADVDLDAPAVADGVAAGHLVEVQKADKPASKAAAKAEPAKTKPRQQTHRES